MKLTIEIIFKGSKKEQDHFRTRIFDMIQYAKKEARDRNNIIKTRLSVNKGLDKRK